MDDDDSIARAALKGLYRLLAQIPPGEEIEAAGVSALLWLILAGLHIDRRSD